MVLLGVVSGCATVITKPADFVAPGFDSLTVEELAVLPVLDHRVDQSKPLNLDGSVLPIAKDSLKERGYMYTVHRDRSLVSNITRDALETPTPEFIATLQPSSARWVLVLALEDFASKITFGSTASAEMSGYLFDRKNRVLSWRNKELGRAGQGGLLGMALKGVMEKAALEGAATSMFHALPTRPK